jgi:radical SAM protein with 4Fe4S-binding SPASM domain
MNCPSNEWLSDEEFIRQFQNKALAQRIPLSGSVELTYRCNLNCIHCYLGPHPQNLVTADNEISTDFALSIIDSIAEAECLLLLLTGGEPLIRKDFADIYRHAKSKGLLVTVFTNGTLITDSIVELFNSLPPLAVEITLYGATASTYEKITGIKGSYEQCLKGIRKLISNNIRVKLKTVLMTLNSHELSDMEIMARDLGVPFRFDPAVFPRYNGDKTPIEFRISPENAVEKEFSNQERADAWQKFYHRYKNMKMPDTLYTCGAGITSFHIDPIGNLQPCLMPTHIKYDLKTLDFLTGWRHVGSQIRLIKSSINSDCTNCEDQMFCGYCPAFFRLENESENIPSDYLCIMGRYRAKMIKMNIRRDKI